jgi:hypothetical protein
LRVSVISLQKCLRFCKRGEAFKLGTPVVFNVGFALIPAWEDSNAPPFTDSIELFLGHVNIIYCMIALAVDHKKDNSRIAQQDNRMCPEMCQK